MTALTRTLIREIETAPAPIQQELFDFLTFLESRQPPSRAGNRQLTLLPLAQVAWAVDWSNPKKDEAWHHSRLGTPVPVGRLNP